MCSDISRETIWRKTPHGEYASQSHPQITPPPKSMRATKWKGGLLPNTLSIKGRVIVGSREQRTRNSTGQKDCDQGESSLFFRQANAIPILYKGLYFGAKQCPLQPLQVLFHRKGASIGRWSSSHWPCWSPNIFCITHHKNVWALQTGKSLGFRA